MKVRLERDADWVEFERLDRVVFKVRKGFFDEDSARLGAGCELSRA